ncbi:hypothetical protein D3C81_1171690 [compost metagenome]
MLVRHPLGKTGAHQRLRGALQIVRQRPVGETQGQIRPIAADHRRRILHQDAVALLARANPLGSQRRLGDVQPQAHHFARQAQLIAQQARLVQHPVVVAAPVAQPIAVADHAFAQQAPGRDKVAVEIVWMQPSGQLAIPQLFERPAEQLLQTVAAELQRQCALHVALHIDDCGSAGHHVAQAVAGSFGLRLFLLDFADVECETDDAALPSLLQHHCLYPLPAGVVRRNVQAQALHEALSGRFEGQQAHAELVAVGRVQGSQPVLQVDFGRSQPPVPRQHWRDLETPLSRMECPPAGAEHFL